MLIRMKILILLVFVVFSIEAKNNRPIIGILAQETGEDWKEYYPEYNSYIAASYVKWVEGSGARAVPIRINEERSYYEDVVHKVNGILFPGGAASLNDSGYKTAGSILYEEVIQINKDESVQLPLWATCLGFELVVHLVADNYLRVPCDSYNTALPLELTKNAKKSHMFGDLPEDVERFIEEKNVTSNFHHYCFSPEQFEKNQKLKKNVKVLSTNVDAEGLEFVSSIEHREWPVYATQWHPEKNPYEWEPEKDPGIPHTYQAVRTSQYFADFFVNEARKNDNKFVNEEEEEKWLIYQHPATYSAQHTAFMQIYLFK